MEGDDLVAQDVVARLDRRRDGDEPGQPVGHHDVVGPVARAGRGRRVCFTGAVDLEEAQRRLVDRLAGAVARRQVVDDGPVVRVGPRVPGQGDGVAGGDADVALGGAGAAVADDVGRAKRCGLDVPEIGLRSCPAHYNGRVRLVREDGRIIALVGDPVDDNVLDKAVSGDLCQAGQQTCQVEMCHCCVPHNVTVMISVVLGG